MIRTPLTDLLGIRHPIVQTGMGYVSGARLTAATSAAGGLGIIASATMSPETLRSVISEVKERTDAPFGVNVRSDAPDAAERVELIIAEGVRVASFALAPRRELIARLKDAGVVVIPSIGARRHAEKVAAWGADAVIVQGGEAGGHTGAVPTSLLLPQVVDAVDIPVIGGGRVLRRPRPGRGARLRRRRDRHGHPVPADQRQPGARRGQAGLPGQRRHRHGGHHPGRRRAAPGAAHRRWSSGWTRPGRCAACCRSARSAAAFRELSGLSWPELLRQGRAMRRGTGLTWGQVLMAANTPMLLRAAMVDGRPDLGLMSSGQVAGLIDDLPSCAELIARIMAEAEQCLARLGRLGDQDPTSG